MHSISSCFDYFPSPSLTKSSVRLGPVFLIAFQAPTVHWPNRKQLSPDSPVAYFSSRIDPLSNSSILTLEARFVPALFISMRDVGSLPPCLLSPICPPLRDSTACPDGHLLAAARGFPVFAPFPLWKREIWPLPFCVDPPLLLFL